MNVLNDVFIPNVHEAFQTYEKKDDILLCAFGTHSKTGQQILEKNGQKKDDYYMDFTPDFEIDDEEDEE